MKEVTNIIVIESKMWFRTDMSSFLTELGQDPKAAGVSKSGNPVSLSILWPTVT